MVGCGGMCRMDVCWFFLKEGLNVVCRWVVGCWVRGGLCCLCER